MRAVKRKWNYGKYSSDSRTPECGKIDSFQSSDSTRKAIVNEEAGTTRDRQYGKVEWCGQEFSVIDTGGWVVNSEDIFEEEINKQVALAIEEADVILFMVDVKTGAVDLDDHVAAILRRSDKPVILVANKADSNEWQYNAAEFYSFGLGDPFVCRQPAVRERAICWTRY